MHYILLFLLLSTGVMACSKADKSPNDEAMMAYSGQNQYCNDPEAINYNHDFPGTANNTVCVYPTDPFKGAYELVDTVYTADYASYYTKTYMINIYAIDKVKMALVGLCGPNDSLRLTAGRYYKGSLDSTIGIGQALCAPKDTINGTVAVDSLGNLKLLFTKYSDTAGVKFHVGTAIKIP